MDNKVILIINRSDSKCGNCGQGANPREIAHDTIIEYSPNTGRPGCKAKFTHVESHYVGLDMKTRCLEMRPDLIWCGMEN